MTVQATTQVIYDGPRRFIVELRGRADDADGQEVGAIKVDVSELQPPAVGLKLERLTGNVNGGVVELSDANAVFAVCEGQLDRDYRRTGPVLTVGDITLTTRGFELDSNYSLALEFVKKLP